MKLRRYRLLKTLTTNLNLKTNVDAGLTAICFSVLRTGELKFYDVDVHSNRLAKAILMSTHNIGFYEEISKIIFQLSLKYHQMFCPHLKSSLVCGHELQRCQYSSLTGFPQSLHSRSSHLVSCTLYPNCILS